MAIDSVLHAVSIIFQVLLLDLVLSGDNAVLIALACRSLPPRQVTQALMIGTVAAVALRVLFTTLTSWLLRVPMLKLAGAAFLLVIAIRLLAAEEDETRSINNDAPSSVTGAVTTLLVADLVMSLDNAVALAAVSQGNVLYLLLGLLISVPLLMYGSKLFIYWLQEYPLLIPISGALLGYIAGNIAMSDPAIVDAVRTQSPALIVLVPLLCAVFVVLQGRIIERRRTQLRRPATLSIPKEPQDSSNIVTGAREARTTNISRPARRIAQEAIPSSVYPKETVLEDRLDRGTIKDAEEPIGSMTTPKGDQENVEPVNYFTLRSILGSTFAQLTIGVILAFFCIVLLPKKLAIAILIGMTLLMVFKVI